MSRSTLLVIPVHNRRATTLCCLAHLSATGVLAWAEVAVVDDGSTDGTGEAVRAGFPEVHLLPGSGQLWWTGGIRQGMQYGQERGMDFLGWLNDDCLPEPGTLRLLVDHAARTGHIAAGWARTPSGDFYGGGRKTWRGIKDVHPLTPERTFPCDSASGNCVIIPRAVVAAIGYPDAERLPHTLADCDYLLDATARGFGLDLLGAAICRNEDNLGAHAESWLLGEAPPWKVWSTFRSYKSVLYPPAALHFHRKHWGWWGGWLLGRHYLKLVVFCLVRLLVPRNLLCRLLASRSRAFRRWQHHHPETFPPSPAAVLPGQPGDA